MAPFLFRVGASDKPGAVRGRFAVRLGLRLARGLPNQEGALVPLARGAGPFTSVEKEGLAADGLSTGALERLADADAFGCCSGLSRRAALWVIRAYTCPVVRYGLSRCREQGGGGSSKSSAVARGAAAQRRCGAGPEPQTTRPQAGLIHRNRAVGPRCRRWRSSAWTCR